MKENEYIEKLDKIEKEHAELIERIALPCRSNSSVFTETAKLDAIREELKNSPYQETFENGLASIWTKVPLDKLPKQILLISSHIDIVPFITKCSSELTETGFYHGTYDNLGPNAAEVIMMKEENFPNNVVFAFTGDEETGGCKGAKEAAKKFVDMGKMVNLCIALDVTFEGFDDSKLFSLENLTYGYLGRQMNEFVANSVLAIENEETDFCFIKANKYNIPSAFKNNIPEVIENTSGMYDEAFAYRDINLPACSICLPSEGDMHSNSGLYIKQPVFEGYILSVTSIIHSLCKCHEYLINSYKIARKNLYDKAKEIEYIRPKPTYESYYGYQNDTKSDYPYPYTSSYYEDMFVNDILEFTAKYSTEDWYIEEFSELIPDLIEFALEYGEGREEDFVTEIEIPDEYLLQFWDNTYENSSPEEKQALIEKIKDFLRHIYQIAFNEYEQEEPEYDDDDDYECDDEYSYMQYLNRKCEQDEYESNYQGFTKNQNYDDYDDYNMSDDNNGYNYEL